MTTTHGSMAAAWHAEITRKLLHLSSAAIAAGCSVLPRSVMLWLLGGCVAIALLVEVLRHTHAGFRNVFRGTVGFMVRAVEWNRVCGATYVLIAAWLSVYLFPKNVAIAVILILSVSDSAASLIGLRFGRSRFLGKSMAGSLSFFVTAYAILWLTLPFSAPVLFAAACVATLVEALPTPRWGPVELSDNLTVPLLTGAALVWLTAWA